ncbi:MADS-box transcription factor 26-like isoform X2 [Iris pallida]|uniref:MADS-box transcription factor 26-like isoform X2 n=1 Tax=Iris pallida TaxID=29817 RepID=A0AAX6FXS2_IRIPA|nr:MADS-box transcription factor 26-like isoform X2 [Iris pallida]KAJ6824785.1 MADS-box transcription factor 26-like isoform X2 [Iris pallida]
MARGKVQLRRIDNPVHRQVTFCKRRAGLLKKARELSVLCDADIGIIVFSSHGKMYELSTNGTMQDMIQRYLTTCAESPVQSGDTNPTEQENVNEISTLKQEIDILHKGLRYMFGEGPGLMTLDELQALERNLEIWMYHIRSAKMQIMFQEIQQLKHKEGILTAANEILQDKIIEQNRAFDVSPAIGEFPYPLTIQNGIFNFSCLN